MQRCSSEKPNDQKKIGNLFVKEIIVVLIVELIYEMRF
jgi:hypothetical protein